MPNPLQSLRQLFAGPPQQLGQVVAIDGNIVTLELPGGGQIKARGAATVDQYVFEQNGQILGDAPTLPIDVIEI
jgi:hypothetical protein